jgi:hypothetical protein
MPPLMRFWFNLHRHNTRPLKDRNMHKIERVFFALPVKAYVRWHHLRHKFKNRRTSPEVLFYAPEEDA